MFDFCEIYMSMYQDLRDIHMESTTFYVKAHCVQTQNPMDVEPYGFRAHDWLNEDSMLDTSKYWFFIYDFLLSDGTTPPTHHGT